jgi:hypothetical protein
MKAQVAGKVLLVLRWDKAPAASRKWLFGLRAHIAKLPQTIASGRLGQRSDETDNFLQTSSKIVPSSASLPAIHS